MNFNLVTFGPVTDRQTNRKKQTRGHCALGQMGSKTKPFSRFKPLCHQKIYTVTTEWGRSSVPVQWYPKSKFGLTLDVFFILIQTKNKMVLER